jgi:hypothetical protein
MYVPFPRRDLPPACSWVTLLTRLIIARVAFALQLLSGESTYLQGDCCDLFVMRLNNCITVLVQVTDLHVLDIDSGISASVCSQRNNGNTKRFE